MRETATNSAANNLRFYEALWSETRLTRPDSFNTWPLIESLLPQAASRLEIGPGLRPRLPVADTHFIDLSDTVTSRLNAAGARATTGHAGSLPFADASMDLVCAFDVIEHLDDDLPAFREMSRVLKDRGLLILSVPLHPASWTSFDDFVGHVRRYDPLHLRATLQSHQLSIEQSAAFGMQPANPRLLDLGIWLLTYQRSISLFWYNWLILPLRLYFQSPLHFTEDMVDCTSVTEIVLVCRRCDRDGKNEASL